VSETKHSPEPIRVEMQTLMGETYVGRILDNNGHEVVRTDCGVYPPDAVTALRIVAAYNACVGVPTEALEAGAVHGAISLLAEYLRPESHDCGCHRDPGRWDKDAAACHQCRMRRVLRALGRLK